MIYEELAERLRYCAEEQNGCGICALSSDCVLRVGLLTQAADAIEKFIEVIQNHDFLESLIKPCWIPVTEENHPKAYEPVMVIYIGWNDALPHRDCTAYWSEDEDLWRWAETNDKVKVPITHYMPLPPLPEPPKEGK